MYTPTENELVQKSARPSTGHILHSPSTPSIPDSIPAACGSPVTLCRCRVLLSPPVAAALPSSLLIRRKERSCLLAARDPLRSPLSIERKRSYSHKSRTQAGPVRVHLSSSSPPSYLVSVISCSANEQRVEEKKRRKNRHCRRRRRRGRRRRRRRRRGASRRHDDDSRETLRGLYVRVSE